MMIYFWRGEAGLGPRPTIYPGSDLLGVVSIRGPVALLYIRLWPFLRCL
jgi:hypothetical protein